MDLFGIGAAIQNGISQGIIGFLDTITGQVIQATASLLQWLVFSPTDLATIPDFQTLLYTVQGMGVAWSVVLAMKELNMAALDPDGRPPSQVVRGLVIAVVAIYVTPLFVELAVTVNNALCALILRFPLAGQVHDNQLLNDIGKYLIAGGSVPGGDPLGALGSVLGTYSFVLLLALIVIAISLVVVAVNNGVRFIELLFLLAIAPLLASSKVTAGELFDVWGRELIAVVFAEAVQLFSIHFGLAFLINPPMVIPLGGVAGSAVPGLVIGLGGMIFAIRGPKTLRAILYRGTSAAGGMQAAGTAALRAIAMAAK